MIDYIFPNNPIIKSTKWESLVDLLKCQSCGSHQLRVQPSELVCSSCSATYPLLDGATIFRTPPESVKVFPIEHVSNQISSIIFDWLSSLSGYSLNMSSPSELQPSFYIRLVVS
jgi:hypothetical protein